MPLDADSSKIDHSEFIPRVTLYSTTPRVTLYSTSCKNNLHCQQISEIIITLRCSNGRRFSRNFDGGLFEKDMLAMNIFNVILHNIVIGAKHVAKKRRRLPDMHLDRFH